MLELAELAPPVDRSEASIVVAEDAAPKGARSSTSPEPLKLEVESPRKPNTALLGEQKRPQRHKVSPEAEEVPFATPPITLPTGKVVEMTNGCVLAAQE